MAVLKQRQKSIEAKFARDAELEFHVRIRSFRFIAAWAASLRDDPANGADDLVQKLIREDMRVPGDDSAIAVLQEYLGDLADEALLRRKLKEFAQDARAVVLYDKAG
ncbi:ATPase inhibitor subunit zeta [Tropicimonas marinistellae]|uniref:ATPase inhibitor subunit zeta n=1 Tax=Tropicimonas marinistellae TaxID=1739787 RepID=UPI00082D72C0|nr:ATPase inhibitor subunit zeta [Tropicimonas marinistellae]